jgi:hypothetical protein
MRKKLATLMLMGLLAFSVVPETFGAADAPPTTSPSAPKMVEYKDVERGFKLSRPEAWEDLGPGRPPVVAIFLHVGPDQDSVADTVTVSVMPSNRSTVETQVEPTYTVWFSGGPHRGTAREIMEQIRASARSSGIRNSTVDEYASVIISDAPYFLAKELLDFLESLSFESKFDRALRYLAEMESSGLRILAKD